MSRPDPGGNFASDEHRRVMAAVSNPDDDPIDMEELVDVRVAHDDYLDIDGEDVAEILADLEADGHVKKLKDGWRNTASGFDLLTGPPEEGT